MTSLTDDVTDDVIAREEPPPAAASLALFLSPCSDVGRTCSGELSESPLDACELSLSDDPGRPAACPCPSAPVDRDRMYCDWVAVVGCTPSWLMACCSAARRLLSRRNSDIDGRWWRRPSLTVRTPLVARPTELSRGRRPTFTLMVVPLSGVAWTRTSVPADRIRETTWTWSRPWTAVPLMCEITSPARRPASSAGLPGSTTCTPHTHVTNLHTTAISG